MSAVDVTPVRDAAGRTHEPNPLGEHACLACALPYPCETARGGEQLDFGVCRCGRFHQPRERAVECKYCGSMTADHHRVCGRCQREVALT